MVNLPSQLTPSELLFYQEIPQFIAELLRGSHSLRKVGKLPEAERCAQDAAESSQRSNVHADLAVALIYLADVHREMGQTESAVTNYHRAYRIFQRQPPHYQRHNEAVSAYALGLAHQLGDRTSDALEWYQISGELFEKVEKDWSRVNDLDQVKICIRIRNWIKALMGYLTDMWVHTNAGFIWIPIIPLDIEKEKYPETSESKIETLDGQSFRVQSLEAEQYPSLESDTVYYALNVPDEADESLDAGAGDYVLVEQRDIPEQEGLGVLKSDVGQDFGHFKLDDEENVNFVRTDAQVIGDKGLDEGMRVGYITALLKPILSLPDSSAPKLPDPLTDSDDE
ncbi:MAG: tetratricopeptide repeat protein [Chloroflexi bacterium]|nr:tetratricopeptide repeat protein [Chloroflexota bacterium]